MLPGVAECVAASSAGACASQSPPAVMHSVVAEAAPKRPGEGEAAASAEADEAGCAEQQPQQLMAVALAAALALPELAAPTKEESGPGEVGHLLQELERQAALRRRAEQQAAARAEQLAEARRGAKKARRQQANAERRASAAEEAQSQAQAAVSLAATECQMAQAEAAELRRQLGALKRQLTEVHRQFAAARGQLATSGAALDAATLLAAKASQAVQQQERQQQAAQQQAAAERRELEAGQRRLEAAAQAMLDSLPMLLRRLGLGIDDVQAQQLLQEWRQRQEATLLAAGERGHEAPLPQEEQQLQQLEVHKEQQSIRPRLPLGNGQEQCLVDEQQAAKQPADHALLAQDLLMPGAQDV